MKPDAHLLNTESKLSPEVQPFVPNHLKDQRPIGTASATHGSLTGTRQCFQEPGQRGAVPRDRGPRSDLWSISSHFSREKGQAKDSQSSQVNRHGYSSSRRAKKAPRTKHPTLDCSHSEQPRQASQPSTEFISQQTRRSLYVKETTLSKAESIKVQQRDSDSFEVKLSDFPELGLPGPGRGGLAASPVAPPSAPQTPGTNTSLGKGQTADSLQRTQTPRSQETVLKSIRGHTPGPLGSTPTSSAASWATVACQPPKRTSPRPAGTISKPPSASKEETKNEGPEKTSEKKKRNKKKKKSKQADESEEAKSEVLGVEQEPPKFEDEEEFPNLTHDVVGCTKGQSPAPSRLAQNPSKMPRECGSTRDSRDVTSYVDGPPHQDMRGKSRAPGSKLPLPASPTTDSKKDQPEKTSGKKSKVPVQLDLGNMLAVLEQKQISQKSKQECKPIILSVGSGPPVAQKDSAQKKHPWQPEKIAHNPLDSTSPLVKKGKQREVPKAKKPTPLKRIILKEREERKQKRLLEERGSDGPVSDSLLLSAEEVELEGVTSELDEQGPSGDDEPCEDYPEEHGPPDAEQPDTEQPADTKPEQVEVEQQPSKDSVLGDADAVQQPKIHSRKFRDYCNQMLNKDVDESVTGLLKELVRFQDRLYQKDPMKARMKRRLVMGLREVLKHLKLRKVKCVIISPNCERIQSKGGLDETLHTIIDTCREQSVPFVFALSRKALGRCVNKAVPVSLVGIFNYDGAQDLYHKMIELSSEARKAYEVMIANLEKTSAATEEVSDNQLNADTASELTETEEPEYIKIWKKMLEKEHNHKFLNFEKQLPTSTVGHEPTLECEDEGS
ncbi:selenocysteine insertion sequence-binding protein 2-like isoform X2 [Brienomyrus brachyistius]|uniref:selenocysteine insertion sequence-binding protein 2-like isoform X2 n=1 Tax=Brienomyrus brachyistius TaxID=42636 RepID=UPI0020B41CB7|nr:selenocysteine insertion sequence-binding protein 2-like isoform X2 [Brienomyrus brachyistius]